MDKIALAPQMVACINAFLAANQQSDATTRFATDEIVELFESLMAEPGQRVEPVWSTKNGGWQWLPVT